MPREPDPFVSARNEQLRRHVNAGLPLKEFAVEQRISVTLISKCLVTLGFRKRFITDDEWHAVQLMRRNQPATTPEETYAKAA